jgi:nucleoside-diphosphate-sugar epimerase
MALEYSEIKMMTNGEEKRDFLHADDCARAILRILRNYDEYTKEEEIHIASHNWHSILEIAEIIAIKTGSKVTPGLVTDESRLNTLISPNPKFKHLVEDAISLETGITNLITQTKLVTK